MTLVVPCLDNMFMVLLISELAKIGVTKHFFLDSASLGLEGVSVCVCLACVGMDFYHSIVHTLNSSKKLNFLCL